MCAAAPLTEDLEDIGEYGTHFEGDMVLTEEQRKAVESDESSNRNGLRDVTKHWPKGTVVYYIVKDDFDEKHIQMIKDAISEIANKSCIKFHKRKTKDEHAVIIQGSEHGCFSHVGYIKPSNESSSEEDLRQVLNLAKGCFKHGTIIHEMLHTIGFHHMQSTYNRDDFVTILWENIIPGHEHNFEKHSNKTINDYGVPYDYSSVMHYSEKAFSKNGNNTIIPKQPDVVIGQRNGLSKDDIVKLTKMYCKSTTEEEPVEKN